MRGSSTSTSTSTRSSSSTSTAAAANTMASRLHTTTGDHQTSSIRSLVHPLPPKEGRIVVGCDRGKGLGGRLRVQEIDIARWVERAAPVCVCVWCVCVCVCV